MQESKRSGILPEFHPFSRFGPGRIAGLLSAVYSPLLLQLPNEKRRELQRSWDEYDHAVEHEPDTVGACGFFSVVGGDIAGMGSWNPLDWPDHAVIGHNCVHPDHQGQGLGRMQIGEILQRLGGKGFRRVLVNTDEHPFFEPARRMYLGCGFGENRRYPGVLLPRYSMIEYEKSLEGTVE